MHTIKSFDLLPIYLIMVISWFSAKLSFQAICKNGGVNLKVRGLTGTWGGCRQKREILQKFGKNWGGATAPPAPPSMIWGRFRSSDMYFDYARCVKDEIERIHLYFCKLTLGVKPSTPTDGIYAELGRYPLKIFRQTQMVKFAIRMSNLNGSRNALKVLIEDDMKWHYNWFSQVTDIIKSNDIVDENDTNESIKKKIIGNCNHSLFERINNCDQGKKLRTYRKFKSVIKFEPYLDTIENANLKCKWNVCFLFSNLKEQQKSGRSPFTVS